MPDNLTPEDRRKTMRAVKGKGTGLERRLFSTLAGMRLRGWNKNASYVPGKPDVVFPKHELAIFVDGCFWHGCPHCARPLPQANRQYWEHKIGRNIALAESHDDALRCLGWVVVRIWEHELRTPTTRAKVKARIRRGLRQREKGVGDGT